MREVISEAMRLASEGIVEFLDNNDDYVTLKISADCIVDEEVLNRCFALGALCSILMIKTHSAPEPISPMLIQAVIEGVDSIMEDRWLETVSPPVAKVLALIPSNFDAPIPDDPNLRSLIRGKFAGTVVRFLFIVDAHMADKFSSMMQYSEHQLAKDPGRNCVDRSILKHCWVLLRLCWTHRKSTRHSLWD